jgi:hypothetical protein
MRFVIYDDATLEPITVVNIPGFTERDIEDHGCRYRLVVPSMVTPRKVHDRMPIEEIMRIVDLKFEPIMRANVVTKTVQRSWMCFTKQDELALLLMPSWLPGQRGAIDEIQKQNDGLTNMLIQLLFESGQ